MTADGLKNSKQFSFDVFWQKNAISWYSYESIVEQKQLQVKLIERNSKPQFG